MEVVEGGLAFEVPDEAGSVFYNPAMELNRDLTVAVLRAARTLVVSDDEGATYLDAMTATGIRGVRASTAGYRVTVCDVDPAAIDRAEANLNHHGVDADVVHDDVRRHLYGARYDVVDLDPFGSPIPYLDAAICATRQLLCVTATDTAPLCGAHFDAGVRRYGAVPYNTEYHAEVGLRILLGAVVRTAARYDVAPWPVVCHATRHYVRGYFSLEHGATPADDCVDRLGYIVHCPTCLHRSEIEGLAPPLPEGCAHCGESARRIGPIWLGRYVDETWLNAVLAAIDSTMGEAARAERLVERLRAELEPSSHFDHHVICDRLEIPAAPLEAVLDAIEATGHAVSRTHFGGTTFKTDASIEVVERAIATLPESA